MSLRFTESPNARSKSITTADGIDTFGILNQHSTGNAAYQVGISEDVGTRRYMEDAHSFVVDYAGVRGQGFFAIFDGHAGKHAAEWCGAHFHEYLLDALRTSSSATIPGLVDKRISRLSEESDGKIHSGCTVVTAFLRIEDADGRQSFLPTPPLSPPSPTESGSRSGSESPTEPTEDSKEMCKKAKSKSPASASRFARALKSLSGSSPTLTSSPTALPAIRSPTPPASTETHTLPINPPQSSRRVLYTANAGDARGVLCRAGRAVRLTYDHKGSDKQEAKRITDAGGFVMSGRVNGVLAVTRSLGDSSMKEYVVGSPYTTETELGSDDEFVILACDGLWDITGDQGAIDLVRHISDAQAAAETLVKHALERQTNDNVTVLVVRFKALGSSEFV
ncbi:phosphatase 2C-like domain-containing protein [Suillus paluster]|uniref:phosphatase 2C-like domain-containing protein n=1 Tax=Suillus paluster TaxID=48578 RepID=UPI001B86F4C4|nr:phosphatase 2C-like domain-containing protein [Suillus paluster]KAG1751458.1 phosphatase 2C-like domain-containing protein [Suillus paluster]